MSLDQSNVSSDFICPVCDYPLRGLTYLKAENVPAAGPGILGPTTRVDCPECGLRIDVAKLADNPHPTHRSILYRSPGLNLMARPMLWLLPAGSVAVALYWPFAVLFGMEGPARWIAFVGVVLVVLFIWAWLHRRIYREYGGCAGLIRSVWSQLMILVYLAGLIMVLAGLVGVYMILLSVLSPSIFPGVQVWDILIVCAVTLFGVTMLYCARACDKQVSRYCHRIENEARH